ncbi:MAG: hypothetical protein ACRD2H_05870 [Terriglobales bacterium]
MPDNQLNLGINVDVGQLTAGMDAAATTVSESSTKMTASFQSAAAAAKALAEANALMEGIMAAAGGPLKENTGALEEYTAASARAAAAQEFLATATTETAAATTKAAAATGQMGGMQAYAVGRVAAMGAGLEREGYLFGLMAREIPGIAGLMSVIFPVAMAAMFAYALAEVVVEVRTWYDATFELKQVTADLIQLGESLHTEQETTMDKMTGLASIVTSFGDLSPIRLKLKIPQKDLDNLERAGFDVRTLVNVLQRVGTVSDAAAQMDNIGAAIGQVSQRIASLQALLGSTPDVSGLPGIAGTLGRLTEMVLGRDPKALQGKIEAGKQMLQALNAIQDNIRAAQTNDRLEFAGKQADQEARAEKTYEEKLKEIERTYAEVSKKFHQNVAHAIQSARLGATAGIDLDAAKAFLSGVPQVAPGAAPADQRLADIQLRAAAAHQERMIALQREYAAQSLAVGQITGKQELALEKELADAEYAVKKAELEREIAEIKPGSASNLEERDNLLRQIARLRAQLQQIKDERDAQIAKATGQAQKNKGETLTDKFADKQFAAFNRGMDQAVQGVMQGTQTMAQAWRRMFADMVISQAEALAQMILRNIEHRATMLAITASGLSAKQVIEDSANAKARLGDAKTGAVHVWASVLKALPFPLNVAVAPVAAAAEFAYMLAFEHGGVVPKTAPALVHEHEMVLPQHIADHVLRTAGGQSGSGSGSTIHVHNSVSALDGADAHSVLTRNSSGVAAGLHRELRRRGLA